MSEVLARLHYDVAKHLERIEKMFKEGAKLTLLVRNPSLNDGDVLFTSDSMEDILASLGKLSKKKPWK